MTHHGWVHIWPCKQNVVQETGIILHLMVMSFILEMITLHTGTFLCGNSIGLLFILIRVLPHDNAITSSVFKGLTITIQFRILGLYLSCNMNTFKLKRKQKHC